MNPLALYTVTGAFLFLLGLWSMSTRAHLLWKVLAFNVMGTGIFMLLLSAPPRLDPREADPVPQAMVLTGIVVTAAATAVTLGLALRVLARTGSPFLDPERAFADRGGDPVGADHDHGPTRGGGAEDGEDQGREPSQGEGARETEGR